jgi:choline transporter-like protein 2/4/5
VQEAAQKALEYTPCSTSNHSVCQFLAYGGDQYTIYLQIFQLFMLFWVMNFIIALGQMTLAGAFASYYFAFTKPNDIPAFPVSAALWRSLR